MSLKKQIQRNIQRQNERYLSQYQGELIKGWSKLPNQQKSIIANMSRNGITPADLEQARADGANDAYKRTAPAVVAVCYAALGIVLKEKYGFDNEQVEEAIGAVDAKIAMTIDNEEIADELEEKCGLRIRSAEGVDRIETVG